MPGQKRSMWPYCPEICFTGSSNVATRRRLRPKTSKNSFQNVCFSAFSRVSPVHSLVKRMALCRISFQDRGIGQSVRVESSGKPGVVKRGEGEVSGGATLGFDPTLSELVV